MRLHRGHYHICVLEGLLTKTTATAMATATATTTAAANNSGSSKAMPETASAAQELHKHITSLIAGSRHPEATGYRGVFTVCKGGCIKHRTQKA